MTGEDPLPKALTDSIRTDPILSVWLPKPGGGQRRMAVLSDRDAAAWEALGSRVAAALEPRFHAAVLANRAVAAPPLTFAPLRPALRRARRLAEDLARRSGAVLRTDVASFYPTVTPPALHRVLASMGADAADACRAATMLEGWGSGGYPGLPVGPPASAVMANAVLWPLDAALTGLSFLRWVDDYVIGLASDRDAVVVLERIDEVLDRLGLARSERKTAVLPGGGPLPWLGRSAVAVPTG